MKKEFMFKILIINMMVFLPMVLLAQPSSNPFDEASNSDPDTVPIDGGLSLLVAAGVGYGTKKLQEKRLKDK